MIRNGKTLLAARPIRDMFSEKRDGVGGVSFGLSQAGYDIRIAQDVVLHPFRRFKLAHTIEYYDMPNDLVAVLHDKSTWIREGLILGNTVAEPGWRGHLTVELFYFGWGVLKIPKGAGLGQMLFSVLENPADYGDGKYQNQENRPVRARRRG